MRRAALRGSGPLRARRAALVLLALVASLLAAGCGSEEQVRERDLTVGASPAPAPTGAPRAEGEVRIAVVTHGQSSSRFWAVVRNGVEAGARQSDVSLTYRAPDVYSIEVMADLLEQAIAEQPDGLVVSLPEPGLEPLVRRAIREGIPVVSINSGSDIAARLGVLAHVGQPEDRAGLEAGRRLARAGVRRALCVNQDPTNVGPQARCAGLRRAMREVGGSSTTLVIDDEDPATAGRIARGAAAARADGVLTLNATAATLAVEGLRRARMRVALATFDLGPEVLQAVRSGAIRFAVDQQAYLQGFLPVTLLAQKVRHGLFPAQRSIPTGPGFVTRDTAPQALDLTRRSIR